MAYYPIAIDLTDKPCLIVGGGEVALRKAQALLEAGARVTVIAPEVIPELAGLGVNIVTRPYEAGDAEGHALVFAATGDRATNAAISSEAAAACVPVNVVDDPELCTFIVPSVVRRGDLILAVTTSGKSPALSKKIRREIESKYGPEYAELVDLMGKLRDEVKANYASQDEREAVFSRLLDSGILELLRDGKHNEALERARQCI